MSMNIHITAVRDIIVSSTGEHSQQSEWFDCWQTPTEVSYTISRSENPVDCYKKWVQSVSTTRDIPIYEDDDIFGEKDVIGYEKYNPADDHIKELDDWINIHKKSGYTIEVIIL